MDILETYPRDELFQTPIDELRADRRGGAQHARAPPAAAVRAPRHLRPLPVLPGLPAARPLHDRGARADRRHPQAAAARRLAGVHRPGQRVAARPAALRGPRRSRASTIGDFDQADLERRLAEAARSWRDDFVAAAHAEYGEEDGALLARKYADSFPEAYKEDYPPPDRRGRPRPARGHPGRRRPRPVLLPARRTAAPREARLKIFRIGSPLSLSRGAADPVLDGRRGRRRAALRARRPRAAASHIYDFGLRYHRATLPPAAPRAVPGRRQRGVGGRQRGRRVQRASCSPPG